MLPELAETSVSISLINLMHIFFNILILGITFFVRSKIIEFKSIVDKQYYDLEEKIIKTVNDKYVKTDIYNEQHKNVIEKITELKFLHEGKFEELAEKIEKFDDRFETILYSQNKMSQNLAILISNQKQKEAETLRFGEITKMDLP
jgi:hypothetical protein